jgi:hypothetical protein
MTPVEYKEDVRSRLQSRGLDAHDGDVNYVIRARAHRKSTLKNNQPALYGQWNMPVQENVDFDSTDNIIKQLLE